MTDLATIEEQTELFKLHLMNLTGNALPPKEFKKFNIDTRTSNLITALDGVETRIKQAIEELKIQKELIEKSIREEKTQEAYDIKIKEPEELTPEQKETISKAETTTAILQNLVETTEIEQETDTPIEAAKKSTEKIDAAIGLLDQFAHSLAYYDVGILTHYELTTQDIISITQTLEKTRTTELRSPYKRLRQLRDTIIGFKQQEESMLAKTKSKTAAELVEKLTNELKLVEIAEHTSTWHQRKVLPKINKMITILNEIIELLQDYNNEHSKDFKILRDNLLTTTEFIKNTIIPQGKIALTELETAIQQAKTATYSL